MLKGGEHCRDFQMLRGLTCCCCVDKQVPDEQGKPPLSLEKLAQLADRLSLLS